ncbi:extracellular solute-binding protein [Streptomyces sp. NPDC005538]|uniref:ABC transporter substrate-binding protein n=1 Tax=unclassified Streptomyces TaxID=2593676 RepID=UPI0033B3DA2C
MRRQRIATAVALSGLLATLAACGGGSGSSTASADGKGTLTFFTWDAEATMQPLVNEFQKENPGIKIKMSYAPPVDDYINTLQKRLLAHQAADVFILGNKTEQVGGGYVKDLTNLKAVSEVSPFNKAAETYKGKVYGVSTVSWGGGYLVNLDLLAKVGVTKPPATWAEFLAMCAKLKAKGISPLLEPSDGISTTVMAKIGQADQQAGGDLDTQIYDGKTTFSKAWTPSLDSWAQLYQKGLVSKDVAGLKGDQVQSEFISGRVAMIATGSWGVAPVRQGAKKMKIDFWPVPGEQAGQDYWAGAAAPAYAINSRAKNPVAAEKWINFLAGAKGSKIYHDTTGSITTTSTYKPNLDPALAKMYPAVVAGKIWCTWQAWPGANTSPLDAAMLAEVQQTVLGEAKPADVTKALDSKWATLK